MSDPRPSLPGCGERGRSQAPLFLLFGALLGSSVTYLAMRPREGPPAIEAVEARSTDGRPKKKEPDPSPSSASKEEAPALDAPKTMAEDPFDWSSAKMNLSDPGERDLCLSFWYLNMRTVVEGLETNTGHKFKPVAKLHAGPVEILEEQLAFMKEFLAETDRLDKQQQEGK